MELSRGSALTTCDLVHLRHALDEAGEQLLVHKIASINPV
jgi:hypothetical protein